MTLSRSKIFAGMSFADHAKQAKLTIKTEIKEQRPRYNHSTYKPIKDRDKLLAEQTVTIPHITSKQARVRGDEIEYSIAFEGTNGTFFRFQPSNGPETQHPIGIVMASSLCLYTANSENASSIKTELARQYEQFNAWYEAICAEVGAFNRSLPGYIDQAFKDDEEDERNTQALEDELNS
jgi:hypothetical protein